MRGTAYRLALGLGLGLGAVGALAACSGSSGGSPTATVTVTVSSSSAPSSPTTTVVTPSVTIDAAGRPITAWTTPSGRINCLAVPDAGSYYVRCEMLDNAWGTVPPKPDWCQLDWGHGVEVRGGGSGMTCAGDTVVYEGKVGQDGTWWNGQPGSQVIDDPTRGQFVALAYGAALRFGTTTCVSQADGMHCLDSKTGAGFEVARERFVLLGPPSPAPTPASAVTSGTAA